jgi:hypothetical protein
MENPLLLPREPEVKCRIGGPEYDQRTESSTLRRRHCDPRLEVVSSREGHRSEGLLALEREFQVVILEAKSKAAKIQEPSGLWDLEQYLTQRRQEIDRIYDYRYSVLPLVLANLLSNGRLVEDELHGLGEDKLSWIQRCRSISLER